METIMSYKPVFIFPAGERGVNGQAFATFDEAKQSAHRRFMSWTMPIGFDVEESDEPVNYRFDDERGDVSIKSEAA
jgi:hypothetical protein